MRFIFFIFCLLFLAPAFATAIPPNIAILDSKPVDLKDIEKLVSYRWFGEAWTALQNYPDDDEKVMLLKAESLMGLKKYGESLSFFRRIIKETSDGKLRQDSIMREAMLLARLKRYDEALLVYDKLIDEVRSKNLKKRLTWRAFKTALEARKYKEGENRIRHLSGQDVLWWRGWCYFQMKDYTHASNNWEMISKRNNYYPQTLYWRAQIFKKQKEPGQAKSLLGFLTEKFPMTYYGFLGLLELHADPGEWVTDENRWKWEKRHPKNYFDIVEKESKKRKLDPYLVLALMRQESHFRESVVSSAGAVGLMQLMPQTALVLAKSSHAKHFQLAELLDPGVNIRLGTFYLSFLKRLFNGQIPFYLSAYNAGEEGVSRWLSRRKKMNSIEFVEEIPYNETQNYTKKILAAYWAYSWLYRGSVPQSGM